MLEVLNKKLSSQKFRYLCVMGLGWVVDVAIFALAVPWLSIPVSQFLARLLGAAVGFAGHKWFSFHHRQNDPGQFRRQTVSFVLVWLVSYLLTTGGILLLVQTLGVDKIAAKILLEILVVPMNYLMLSHWVFSHRPSAKID